MVRRILARGGGWARLCTCAFHNILTFCEFLQDLTGSRRIAQYEIINPNIYTQRCGEVLEDINKPLPPPVSEAWVFALPFPEARRGCEDQLCRQAELL